MRGLFKRKGSKQWQGRFRIPEELWERRDNLRRLGVHEIRQSQEFALSLGTDKQDLAEATYRVKLTAWDARMATWRSMLEGGPVALTHRNTVALAAEYGAALLARYKDDPQLAPAPGIVQPILANIAGHHLYVRGSRLDHDAVINLAQELAGSNLTDLISSLPEMHKEEPQGARKEALKEILAGLVTYRSNKGYALAPAVAATKGIAIAAETRERLGERMAIREGEAWERLLKYVEGDYGQDPWEANRPAYEPQERAPPALSSIKTLTLLDLLDHKAKTTSIRPKTVADNRAYLTRFITFLGHNDARKVTKGDVRRWRDSLTETDLSPKTISDRYLSAVRAVLSHGVKEFDLPFNAASGITDNRDAAAPQGSKGWKEPEAVEILKATFDGSSKALSKAHKRALFWVPWMLAYTGLRVSEVTQLQGQRLMEEDGIPYLLITPADGSTKSGKAWAVGVHKHLIELGLLEMLKVNGPGPVFYEAYPAGTDLTTVKGKHRALEAAGRVTDWITEELGLKAPLNRPNHAWRHLFTTRGRDSTLPGGRMNEEARNFMMGSRSGTDARESYGDWPPAVLDVEINKLPRFAVVDTGWRPE